MSASTAGSEAAAAAPAAQLPFEDWASMQRRRALRDGAWKIRCEEHHAAGVVTRSVSTWHQAEPWHWWLSEVATLQPCSTAVACGSQAIPSLDFGCAARPASAARELVTGFSQAPKAECSSKAKCSAIRRVPQGPRRCCCECFCDRLHRLDRPLRGCRTLIALKA